MSISTTPIDEAKQRGVEIDIAEHVLDWVNYYEVYYGFILGKLTAKEVKAKLSKIKRQ